MIMREMLETLAGDSAVQITVRERERALLISLNTEMRAH